jgi:hypothetical protein
VLETGAICSTCTSTWLVLAHGLPVQLHVADVAQPRLELRVEHVDEADDRDAVPQQLAHERHVLRVARLARHHHDLRARPPQLGADVVERRDERGRDVGLLEPRVEAHGDLDVVQRDENRHGWDDAWVAWRR